MEKSPAAKLFIAMFKIDLEKRPRLQYAMVSYKNTVRRFMQTAKKFYGMTWWYRNQNTQLNLYFDYPTTWNTFHIMFTP